MKVTRKQNAGCEEWFAPDELVTVLMLSVSGTGGSQLLLWSNKQQGVGLFSPNDFNITDASLPAEWVAGIDLNGNIILAPRDWLIPGFWERYHESEVSAVSTFSKWRSVLEVSAPSLRR
jgi:hypothetical protein